MGNILRTRKLPFGEDGNPARKRRRLTYLEGGFRAPPPSASFDSLNNDCLVHILSYLNYETMNIVAVCSQACREARSNDSLNQTRTRTIVCSERATGRSIYNILCRWTQGLALGDRPVHLRIENAFNIGPDPNGRSVTPHEAAEAYFGMQNRVASVDLSIDPEHVAAGREVDNDSIECILHTCADMRELDMSSVTVADAYSLFATLHLDCQDLKCLTWNNSDGVSLNGTDMRFSQIVALSLDDSCFRSPCQSVDATRQLFEQPIANDRRLEHYLIRECSHLERLSIKNATWCLQENPLEKFPVSQGMLIKMVRKHQTLQWLRSDLSAENVAMLQQERPEVTFVSD